MRLWGLVVAIGLLVTAIGVDSRSIRALSSDPIPVASSLPAGVLDADGRQPAAEGASAAGIVGRAGVARAIPIPWATFGARLPWGALEKLGEVVRRQTFLEDLRQWRVARALREAEVPDTLKRYFDDVRGDPSTRRTVCRKGLGTLFGTFADEYSLGGREQNTELVDVILDEELRDLPPEVRELVADHLGNQLSKLQPHSVDRTARSLIKEVCG